MAANPEEKPSPQSIRDVINAAMEDDRKAKIQLDLLNGLFESMVSELPHVVDDRVRMIFNKMARLKPEEKNMGVIKSLTLGEYSTTMVFEIPVVTKYTQYSELDVRELPGYIKLHEIAREKDVALRLTGLMAGEEGSRQVILFIDISKSYEEGAADPAGHYPDLPPIIIPPQKENFDRDTPGNFRF